MAAEDDNDEKECDEDDSSDEVDARGLDYDTLYDLHRAGKCDTVQVRHCGKKKTLVLAMVTLKQRKKLRAVIENAGPDIKSWVPWPNAESDKKKAAAQKAKPKKPNNLFKSKPKASLGPNAKESEDDTDNDRIMKKKSPVEKAKKKQDSGGNAKGDNKKTSPTKKKGKDAKEKVEEYDSDCIDFSGKDVKIMEDTAFKANGLVKPVAISLSSGFNNTTNGMTYWVITLGDAGKTFFLKPDHLRDVYSIGWGKKEPNKDEPKWPQSLGSLNVRTVEYSKTSLWYRTKTGKTRSRLFFIFELPTAENHAVHDYLKRDLAVLLSLMKKRPKRPAGVLALQHAERSGGTERGLYKFLTDKHNGDFDKTAAAMTDDLHNHFKDGFTFSFDNTLDRFMVDYDIKQFVEKYLGANNWNGISEDDKKACFKDYPKRRVPDWGSIREESY